MRVLSFFMIFFISGCAYLTKNSHQIKVVHYNIFELDSAKLNDPNNEQIKAVKEILNEQEFNILSINEIQFDRPQTPHKNLMTFGQNMYHLTRGLKKVDDKDDWSFSFFQANTGNKAKRYKGTYLRPNDPRVKNVRKFADPINYGLFPGQYSTGMATTYPIIKKVVITDLPWLRFNPKANLKRFRDARGRRLPKDMPLFDKNFVDTVLDIQGKEVHVITLHTVPAYHFGNKVSPNYQRNADQLRFLEWYLTGKTSGAIDLQDEFVPLPENSYFIAMGDWNTEINNTKNPGGHVLKRFASTGRLFPTKGTTQEGRGFGKRRLKMLLDYLYYSPNLELEEAQVLRPLEKRLFLGCGPNSLMQIDEAGRVPVPYQEKGKTCHVTINQKFYRNKIASDHFPLAATLRFKN